MPIYEYRCPSCESETEVILPLRDFGMPQNCPNCAARMRLLMSLPQPALFVVTNTEKMVKTLNDESGGYGLPGVERHGERYKSVIGDSLFNREKAVIGKGF